MAANELPVFGHWQIARSNATPVAAIFSRFGDVARGEPYRLMWSARRVSTVIRKTRRGVWRPGSADATSPIPSLPRQPAARMSRETIQRDFRSLDGIGGISADGRCYYRGARRRVLASLRTRAPRSETREGVIHAFGSVQAGRQFSPPPPVPYSPSPPLLGFRQRLVRPEGGEIRPLLRHAGLSHHPDLSRRGLDRLQRLERPAFRSLPVHPPEPGLQPPGGLCGAADPPRPDPAGGPRQGHVRSGRPAPGGLGRRQPRAAGDRHPPAGAYPPVAGAEH